MQRGSHMSGVSTSHTSPKLRRNLQNTNLAFLPHASYDGRARSVWPRGVSCYLSSENVHIQVKLLAVREAGGMSYTKDWWSTFSGRTDAFRASHTDCPQQTVLTGDLRLTSRMRRSVCRAVFNEYKLKPHPPPGQGDASGWICA